MNLGGLPPFLGFYGKLVVLQRLMRVGEVVLAAFLTQSAVGILFIYMKIFFGTLGGRRLERLVALEESAFLEGLLISGLLLRGRILLFLYMFRCWCIKTFDVLGVRVILKT